MPRSSTVLRVLPAVEAALRVSGAVVALESSVLAQGLPSPANREAAERMLAAIRSRGAVPAITAVVDGTPVIGLSESELRRFLTESNIPKLSARDLPLAVARGGSGATTVAATLTLCVAAGIAVFATGGIGGVHREPAFDESADLLELARSRVVVVCSGAKSILDLEATMERLETLGIPVLGYRTSELPGFVTAQTGIALTARVETVVEVAQVFRIGPSLGRNTGVLVVQAPPGASALEKSEVDDAVGRAISAARKARVRGSALTPFLLAEVQRATRGRSLQANLALLESNAALAAEIALELARGEPA